MCSIVTTISIIIHILIITIITEAWVTVGDSSRRWMYLIVVTIRIVTILVIMVIVIIIVLIISFTGLCATRPLRR